MAKATLVPESIQLTDNQLMRWPLKPFNVCQCEVLKGTKTDTDKNLNQKVSILFRLNYSKQNAQGLTPIWVCITTDNKRSEFSTSRQVLPANWNVKREEVLDTDIT